MQLRPWCGAIMRRAASSVRARADRIAHAQLELRARRVRWQMLVFLAIIGIVGEQQPLEADAPGIAEITHPCRRQRVPVLAALGVAMCIDAKGVVANAECRGSRTA